MRHYIVSALIVIAGGLLAGSPSLIGQTPSAAGATFYKDVLPILQKNCQSCHRPGQIAPMSFLDFQTTRPWARAIRAAVITKKMPPWFADPQYGHFANDRSLKQDDIDTIVKWIDAGAPEGDLKDAPAPVRWPEGGWAIKPDFILDFPEYTVPATRIMEWTTITIPNPFKEDTWITSVEILPDHYDVNHHMGVLMTPRTPDTKYYVPQWVDKKRDEAGHELPRPRSETAARSQVGPLLIASWVPGQEPRDFRPFDAGMLIPANMDLVVQLHYTPNGKEVVDRPRVGFTLAKSPPKNQYVVYITAAPSDAESFAIPPYADNWESPPAESVFNEDVQIVGMMPHMHVRGKDMTFRLEYPDGRQEVILRLPRYDFNWQIHFVPSTALRVPKGTKLVVTAHFDNSPRNKFNPDPSRTVYYGDQTWEEMMQGWVAVVVDKKIDPRKILTQSGPIPTGA